MPFDPATEQPATDRVAARVLLVDADNCVLLFRGCDPARPEAGTWWFTPGGGVDEAETLPMAARRELLEETGLTIDDVGPVVFERVVVFDFEADRFRQTEHFFFVRTERFDVDDRGWTEIERRAVLEHRWWTQTELVTSDEKMYPEVLAQLLEDVLQGPTPQPA
jgi:8-oxo-dGTP pyrophosphatase MutT (NUDIX family)